MSKVKDIIHVMKEIFVHTLILLLKSMKWVLITIVLAGFFAFGAGLGYVGALVKDEPIRDRETILSRMQENAETSFAYFSDGSLIGQIRSDADRRMVELHEIPQHVKDAVMAVEDDNFYEHMGVDLSGLTRAVLQRVTNSDVQTGGSTITQQVARRVFLSTAREDSRKAREIFLAMRLERFMSKDLILQAYLNKVPFGNGSNGYNVYGIKAAAKGIFNIDNLHNLHLAQAAYLAGLPQSPSSYSAYTGTGDFNPGGFERAMKRQRHVLNRMLSENYITQAQYDAAIRFDIKSTLAEKELKAYSMYPYLMIEIEKRAAETLVLMDNPQLDEQDLRNPEYDSLIADAMYELVNGGYQIHTTIDKDLYTEMRAIAENPDLFTPDDDERGVEQIGAIVLDNRTGAILSMMEGRSFEIEQLNHATQMRRQPGSTMKPIVFLPALEEGIIQPGTPIDDIPIVLQDGGARGYHIPQNWDVRFHGIMTARRAFNQSYNIPALWLFNEAVGIDKTWDFARSLGITTLTESDAHARTGIIGGLQHGTTVEELTNAYRSIPNQGRFNRAYMIDRLENTEGEVVYQHRPEPTRVYSEQTAYLMTDMMRTVITSGTATNIMRRFDHYGEIPVVGKTGSTQRDRDAWFIGFSPDIIVGVWAGYDRDHTLTLRSSLPQGPGTQRAMNIWAEIMDSAITLKPEWFKTEQFEQPEDIVRMTVSSVSGKLPSELTRSTGSLVTDLFNRKHVPTETDDHLIRARVVHYNGRNYTALESTPDDMVQEKILIKRERPIYEILNDIEQKLNNTPASQRQLVNGRPATLADYIPDDLDQTAPEEVDPREDNGQKPPPPTGLTLNEVDGRYEIRFTESDSENVVGYRLYRSLDGSDFNHRPGQTVLRGQEPLINDYYSTEYEYAYYVTSVDIMGRESSPSMIVYSDEAESGRFPLPGDRNNEEDNSSSNGRDHEHAGDAPSAPSNVRATVEDGGLSVQISWDANPDAEQVTQYNIYFSSSRNGQYRQIGTTESTSYKYIAITTSGWYTVVAVNDHGSSPPSTTVELEQPDGDE